MLDNPYYLAASIPGFLFGLTFHEYAHARVADLMGDRTARMLGRVTLDPMKHLDLVGTLLFFLTGFGWAKPVPVTPDNFRGNKRVADILVSLAGPGANFLLALISLIILKVAGAALGQIGGDILYIAVEVNIMLAALNLMPIPPLDGSHVLFNLWKRPPGWVYFLYNNGTVILILLLLTGMLGTIMTPFMNVIRVLLDVLTAFLG
ncbi:MAG TPA: site-2 protease family protein [Bacillota bacterium]|nr:site-2 protease family protein [Bacillota bacterium]